MEKQLINPRRSRGAYDRLHLSQAVRVGDLIWVSGQVGIDPETGEPADGVKAQAALAFEGVKAALGEAGAAMADIVELQTFHTDLHGQAADFMTVKDEYIPADFPAWTGLGVAQLARTGLLVEIRAVAAAGSGRGDDPA